MRIGLDYDDTFTLDPREWAKMKELKPRQTVWVCTGREAPTKLFYSHSTEDKVVHCVYGCEPNQTPLWVGNDILFTSEQKAWGKYGHYLMEQRTKLLADVNKSLEKVKQLDEEIDIAWTKAWELN